MKATLSTQLSGSILNLPYGDIMGNFVTPNEALCTIDGFMINQLDKVAALQRGAGVVVGDYFVGVTTGCEISFTFPDIIY